MGVENKSVDLEKNMKDELLHVLVTSESLGDLEHTLKEVSTRDSTQRVPVFCLSSLCLGNVLTPCEKNSI